MSYTWRLKFTDTFTFQPVKHSSAEMFPIFVSLTTQLIFRLVRWSFPSSWWALNLSGSNIKMDSVTKWQQSEVLTHGENKGDRLPLLGHFTLEALPAVQAPASQLEMVRWHWQCLLLLKAPSSKTAQWRKRGPHWQRHRHTTVLYSSFFFF